MDAPARDLGMYRASLVSCCRTDGILLTIQGLTKLSLYNDLMKAVQYLQVEHETCRLWQTVTHQNSVDGPVLLCFAFRTSY